MKQFLLVVVFGFFLGQAYSAHITGGDFSVRHIEGNTFEGTLILYRDCNGAGATFDASIDITVFEQGTDIRFDSLSFTFNGFESYIAELGNACFVPDVCLEIGTYVTTFTLPDNPNGYYLVKERCCRNNVSNNLPNSTNLGFVFTLDIPDPALQNSSPEFVPFPTEGFFCVNGASQINFGAVDSDGDSLVYSLTEPLNGFSSEGNANPIVAQPKPYPVIQWAAGYSTDNQIGGAIPLTINPQTGVITAQPDLLGIFTIAVLVEEYRDGVLIGQIRREIQLESALCDSDLPSEITVETGDTVFNVLANLPFCIDISAIDPNLGDTLFMFATGPLVDGTVQPPGFFPPVDSFSTVEGQFCWTPICSNVSDTSYVLTITAFSLGCSPDTLITTQDIYINVGLEVNEPTQIAEPSTPTGPGAAIIDLYDPSTHCFDFVFFDPNAADSINVVASSDLFVRDEVTIDPAGLDQGEVSIPFCWDVSCEDVRDEPYFVDFFLITTNCEVLDTSIFSVPINVIVQPNEPTVFAQPQPPIFFEFYQADTLNIPLTVLDGNYFDTLNVTAASSLFTLPGNGATISDSLFGNSIVQGNIAWVPSCSDVRPEPYTINYTATANSCRTSDVIEYSIEVFLTLPPENMAEIQMPADGSAYEHFIGDEVIDIDIIGRDPDPYDTLTLTYRGTILNAPAAEPQFEALGLLGAVVGNFAWLPSCDDVNEEAYTVFFDLNSRSCQKNETVSVGVEILVTTPTKGIIEPIQNVMTPNGDGRNEV